MVAAIIIAVIVSASWAAFAGRYWLRARLDDRRVARIGEQVWFEVVQESARRNGPYASSAFEGTRGITQFLRSFGLVNASTRPRVTFAWLRSADDPHHLTRLYVGVNEGSLDTGASVLRAYATSIGARLEPAQPIFPHKQVALAHRTKVRAEDVHDTIQEAGVATQSFARAASDAGDRTSLAVYVTLDGMGAGESQMLKDAMMSAALLSSRGSTLFANQASAAIQRMTADSARMSISAASDSNMGAAISALAAVTSAATALGFTSNASAVGEAHRRRLVSVAAGLIPVIAAFIFAHQWVALAVLVACVLAATYWALTPAVLAEPHQQAASRGMALMPPFLPRPLSLRRGVERMWLQARMSRVNTNSHVDMPVAAFPSGTQVFVAHPSLLFEMFTFPVDATGQGLTAVDRTQSRGLPPNLVDVEEGIFLGISGTNQPVMLDLADLHYSMYTAGAPNSGKTNFLLTVFAGVVKACRDQSGGLRISPIWGETKGEGAYSAWRVARHHPKAIFVDVHNPASNARLALEGPRLSDGGSVPMVLANCVRLVSSLQAAYGDGIRSQAREIFENVLQCAMLLTPEEIEAVGLGEVVNPAKPNIMELAFYLLNGDQRLNPSKRLLTLGAQLNRSDGLREQELSKAIGSMSRFWDDKNGRVYLERTSTVLNKLNDMRNAPMLWTPDPRRIDVYIPQLVEAFAPSVVNMGPYYDATVGQYRAAVDRSVSQRLTRSFNYLLWDYIKGACSGWQEQGKRIPMFFDEVADVAANAAGEDVPNTLEEATKEGRSRGAAYFLGSQYPSQMPEMVRHQVLASRGKFWFTMQNTSDLELAVSDLMAGERHSEGAITTSNVKSLTNGSCFAVMPRDNAVTPPFLLKVPYIKEWAPILFKKGNENVFDAVADYMAMVESKEAA